MVNMSRIKIIPMIITVAIPKQTPTVTAVLIGGKSEALNIHTENSSGFIVDIVKLQSHSIHRPVIVVLFADMTTALTEVCNIEVSLIRNHTCCCSVVC